MAGSSPISTITEIASRSRWRRRLRFAASAVCGSRRCVGVCWKSSGRVTVRSAPTPSWEVLSEEGYSPAPPTVYRALEFLLTQGLVHRLSSLNAFVGCARPGRPHAGQFLLCTACGSAAELNDPDIERAIEHGAAAEGFVCRNHTVEISGLCPHCRGLADRPLEADPPG